MTCSDVAVVAQVGVCSTLHMVIQCQITDTLEESVGQGQILSRTALFFIQKYITVGGAFQPR